MFFQVFPSLFLLIRVLTSHNFRVLSVAWSPDGKQIASGSVDETDVDRALEHVSCFQSICSKIDKINHVPV